MDSHYNAIWWADVLGRLIDQDVAMVHQFALADTWGIVGRTEPHPMYYTYLMYKRFGSVRLRAESDDPPASGSPASSADGRVTVMIVNLGFEAATKPLTIIGAASANSAATWLFDATHQAKQVG